MFGQSSQSEAQQELSLRPCNTQKGGEKLLIDVLSSAYEIPVYLIEGPDWTRTECVKVTMVPGKTYPAEEFRPIF